MKRNANQQSATALLSHGMDHSVLRKVVQQGIRAKRAVCEGHCACSVPAWLCSNPASKSAAAAAAMACHATRLLQHTVAGSAA
jgi:hypothetical protein